MSVAARRRRPRASATCLALLGALLLVSCGGGDPAPKPQAAAIPLRIGTKNFTESEILGELYKQALEAAGVRVRLQPSIGSTEIINQALRNDLIDMYPEYVGILLSVIDGKTPPADARRAYDLAKSIEERRGFTLLAQTRLSDENALAVTTALRRRRAVGSIADLARLRPKARLAAAPEFETREEGMIGLRRVYGLTSVRMTPTNFGEQYVKLDDGSIDVAAVSTTDAQLAGGRYALLRDPKGLFAAQHVAPVISKQALATDGPKVAATLDAVSALLTTPVMQVLNGEVGGNAKRTPAQVAGAFLRTNGLK